LYANETVMTTVTALTADSFFLYKWSHTFSAHGSVSGVQYKIFTAATSV